MKDLDVARLVQRVSVPVLAVIFALVVGGFLIATSGYSPGDAFVTVVQSAFSCSPGYCNVATVLTTAAPLIFTTLGAILVLSAGLFSIGQEGQYAVGGLAAVVVGYALPLPDGVHSVVALVAAAIGGAAVGVIPAIFRIFLGANELIVSIILNSVIMLLLSFLVNYPLRQAGGSTSYTNVVDESARLAIFDPATKLGMNIVIALAFIVIVWLYLARSTWGYEQRMAGAASAFARYSGMRTRAAVIRAAALGGALAGIGGGIQVIGMNYRVIDGFMDGTGFNGLTAAILGGMTVFGGALAALLFSAIMVGAVNGLQIVMGIPREIGATVLALMIVFVSVQTPLVERLELWLSKKRGAAEIARRAAESPVAEG
ncbi:ABC transporter permease [Agromyces sp. ISL-38]|uniref:ABC transporter permease n=1 Tax=Agromyces sp. ISL-38 TaxID=2819107 RepID=UPI001BEAF385|nr:hypothetical protein [Agromyces sp. ISL-38]MBT2498037.1 ABC transporter permease [Agromyces sp. ISL-38]MBT2516887.1 ABC transporter permease [Streptomyces sp. ISL-90]